MFLKTNHLKTKKSICNQQPIQKIQRYNNSQAETLCSVAATQWDIHMKPPTYAFVLPRAPFDEFNPI